MGKRAGLANRFIDRSGTRNGRLTYLEAIGTSKSKHTIWRAVCDCGNIVEATVSRGRQSCGCLRKEKSAERAAARALPKKEKKRREQKNRIRQRERRKTDPTKAMQARLSRLHRLAIANVGGLKTSPTLEQLGYTADDLRQHIERQFTKGMSWENMDCWQIDHIIPISTANTIEDVIALNQLSNLRPLWKAENNAKKDRRDFLV